ncbi:MAG TPA: hypothetical protein VKU02_12885 [Gemmataceae bacterium]|nr:hypothetical protein [Gemmataceae bacterium]
MSARSVQFAAFWLLVLGPGIPRVCPDTGPVAVRGLVVGPDGKPLAGANIYVSTATATNRTEPKVRATSGPDGQFAFQPTQAEVDTNETIVAVTQGLGACWAELAELDKTGHLPPLRLVQDDIPIMGRVLDLENEPVGNATVRVIRVRRMASEDLTPWISDLQGAGRKSLFDLERARTLMTYERLMKPVWGILGIPASVTTDADGRFRLSGFGRERAVELVIEGPGIESRQMTVVTRKEVPAGLPPFIYGARFDHRAAPAKPIVGNVREMGTGKPAAGVEVHCAFVSGSGALTDISPVIGSKATTDGQGRYRLDGVPKSKQYVLGTAGGPYFAAVRFMNDSAGLEPITADFEVERGLQIRGRVIDKVTRKPVRGIVDYFPRPDNPHLKDYPSLAQVSKNTAPIEKDGSFVLVVLPGTGWLCARAIEDRFVRATVRGENGKLPVVLELSRYHAILAIDVPKQEAEQLAYEVSVDPGHTLTGTVTGPDGAAVSGVSAVGLTAAYSLVQLSPPKVKLSTAAFTAFGLQPAEARYLVFWNEDKKLAKAVLVRGDQTGRVAVQLEPFASAAGVLLDSQGRPEAGLKVEARYSSRQSDVLPGELAAGIPGLGGPTLPSPQATTGPDGRFRLEKLIPGMPYDLFVRRGKTDCRLREDCVLAGGECKDVGEIKPEQASTGGTR